MNTPDSGRFLVVCASLFFCISAFAQDENTVGVIVLPVDFEVGQITAGGVVDTLAEQSETACMQMGAALDNWLFEQPGLTPVGYPALGEEEAAIMREHIALFNVAIHQAWVMEDAREGRAFTYSLGEGLVFLKQRTGAEKAMFVSGSTISSTGGRTALKVLEFALFGLMSPLNASLAYAGIVDLESGQIEWVNVGPVGGSDVTDFEGACDAMDRLLEPYPGGSMTILTTPR